MNTIRVSNSLDPDQVRLYVGPDLGPNCLQSLSADDTSRQIEEKVQCANVLIENKSGAMIGHGHAR